MSAPRRREDDRYSRYDDRDRKGRSRRSRSRGVEPADDGNDLWDAQFLDASSGFPRAPPAPSFTHDSGPGPSYSAPYPPYSSGIYDEFPAMSGPSIPAPPQPPTIQWNQHMLLPAPEPPLPPAPPAHHLEDMIKKEEAIESEVRHQKATLSKQREEYSKKANILRKELETLKDQRNELRGDSKRSPSPDSKRFLKENAKLQLEIQNKLKTINNVVDMLNGIIGENRAELPVKTKPEPDKSDSSPERGSAKRKSRSPGAKEKKFNYVYYDPEMHWCRICNEFPPTAKDYLNHLHSAQHHKIASAHLEAPWHGKPNTNEGLPNYPSAPTKRTPIRGLQFFVPSTAWYCKLCDQWIGDLHCASAHLKSIMHSKNYTNFVEQNPHWETDWMSDRQKAFEKSRAAAKTKADEKPNYTAHTITFDKDGFTKKKKEKSPTPGTPERVVEKKKEKKKQKRRRSSSSSSSSDSGRDKKKEKKALAKKSRETKDESDARDEKLISQWMSSLQGDKLSEKERKMLENLKSSMAKAREKGKEVKREQLSRDRQRERERERERVAQVTGQSKRQELREDRDKRDDRDRDKGKEVRGGGGGSGGSGIKAESHSKDPPTNGDKKAGEPKKMPFIGKMPVFKSLTKPSVKVEEHKEVEQKKVDDEATIKKRQEIDAEIRRKVAEFKLKITKNKVVVAPPGLALPMSLGGAVPPLNYTQPPPPLPPRPLLAPFPQTIHRVQKDPVLVSGGPQRPPPHLPAPPANPPPPQQQQPKPAPPKNTAAPNANAKPKGPLHRDFQEALDIIFPSDKKPDHQSHHMSEQQIDMSMMFQGMGPPGMPPHFGPPLGPFGPPMGMLQPQMNGPPMLMGYDYNPPPLFAGPGPPQLYDRQVPMVPSPQPQMGGNMAGGMPTQAQQQENSRIRQKEKDKKMEMEDLAMLGIDAADVGAGIH